MTCSLINPQKIFSKLTFNQGYERTSTEPIISLINSLDNMFRSSIVRLARPSALLNVSRMYSAAATTTPATVRTNTHQPTNSINQESNSTIDMSALKISSNGSKHLYAIFRLHNMPYLVTKGDKVYLPYRLKGADLGDELTLNDVTTLGSPSYTFNDKAGISTRLFDLKATVTEVTREPVYYTVKKKQRCRRTKTYVNEPFQTVLTITELKLK